LVFILTSAGSIAAENLMAPAVIAGELVISDTARVRRKETSLLRH
jgi:hypothetical protein